MEEADKEIKCIVCTSKPMDAVKLECYKSRKTGGSRNQACKVFLCGSSINDGSLSCVNRYLAYYVAKKDYVKAKWVEEKETLEILDDTSPAYPPKIANCDICSGPVRGISVSELHRSYFNSSLDCTFSDCNFIGNREAMIMHLKETHDTSLRMNDAWEDYFDHVIRSKRQ